MARAENQTELKDLSELPDLTQLSVQELRHKASELATQPTHTQLLCQVLKQLHTSKAKFDWVDPNGDTLFHLLAQTPGHDWTALRQTFLEVLPKNWLRQPCEEPLTGVKETPGAILERFDRWIAQKVESLFSTPFEQKNRAGQTVLSTALTHKNLACAQIAWDYNDQLFTLVKDSQTQVEVWIYAMESHTPDEEGQAIMDWLLSSLEKECQKASINFSLYLNQKSDFAEHSKDKWFGNFIVHAAFGPLTKLDLFEHIKKHGYILTESDNKQCEHYSAQIRDYAQLLAQNDNCKAQIANLAKVIVELYLGALGQWITEKFADENRGFLSGSSSEPQKSAALAKLRADVIPFYTNNSPDTLAVFQTEIETFESRIVLAQTLQDQIKVRAWLLQEKKLREPAIDDMTVVLSSVPGITHAAEGARLTAAANAVTPVVAASSKPVFH